MKIDIMTLFPEMFDNVLTESILGRAQKKGIIEIKCHQIRDYTDNKQNQVDDYPYGGGRGCVMMAQPLKSCLDHVIESNSNCTTRVIYLSPQGEKFSQQTAKRLKENYDNLILVCGHYEGVDERFIANCVDEEISIGDYVLTGGEIAAMAVTDCVCRLIPGVLSDEECYKDESHWSGLLEYPQYTRPEVWENTKVPSVLLEGDHKKIQQWRYAQQLKRTRLKRPDMFDKLDLSENEIKLANQVDLNLILNPITLENTGLFEDLFGDNYISFNKEISRDNLELNRSPESYKCYTMLNSGDIAGWFILSFSKPDYYNNLKDGKWANENLDFCVFESAGISHAFKDTEIFDDIVRAVESVCLDFKIRVIRADVDKHEKYFSKLLRNLNFKYRGNVVLDSNTRQAFDKVIKND